MFHDSFGAREWNAAFPSWRTEADSIPKIRRQGDIAFSDSLTGEALQLLLNGEISALRVKGFYPKDLAHRLGKWILHHPDRAVYGQNVADPDAPDGVRYLYYHVDRVGFPRNQLIGKDREDPAWAEYFRRRDEVIQGIRTVTDNRHPIDILLHQLNEAAPNGAALEDLHGQSAFAGIGRVTVPGRNTLLESLPHVDGTWPYQHHYSANIYLYVPNKGGDLEVLRAPEFSADQVAAAPADINFREQFKDSDKIHPTVGELVLLNTRRPHAVTGFDTGPRVSIATFIGHDKGRPLRLYS